MKRQVIFQYIFVLTLFIYSGCLYSQYESRGERYNYTDAEAFYNVGNYYDALPLYELLMQEKKGTVEYQLKAGICHLYLNENPQKAIEYIKAVYDKKPKMINTQYYLAKAYALNYQFKLAKEMYKSAAENGSTEQKNKKEIPHLIEQCNNAIELVKDSLDVEIINLGEQVNSSANEYSPVINADETELIFTYRGEKSIGGRLDKFNKNKLNGSFNEDIYISNFKNNLWEEPISISDSINSNLNEGGIFLSVDDQKLYLFIDTKNASGDIYESIRVGEEWTKPKSLSINSKYWEGHATMFSDGNRMIFSSNRPGGLGGKDLYSAKLQENGSWGEIENLGPTINTMYDEDAPFLHFDGKTFNFSSKGHTSIGGYDIFESEVSKDTSFSKPVNIGYPINTTSDDIFYHVSKNDNVYYSSARKGGFGQNDIYMINVNGIKITGVALLYNDPSSPITKLKVNITNKDRTFNLADTTDVSGRYYFPKLPISDDYILFIEEIDEREIPDSIYVLKGEVIRMGRAYSKSSINDSIVDEKGSYSVELINEEYKNKLDSIENMSDEAILEEYGDKRAPGLVYKVQVAALANSKNFEGSYLEGFGEIEKIVLDDGLTRVTIGKFLVLKEASALLESVKSKGQDDAFIIVFVEGKRTYLKDLIKGGAFVE